MRRLIQLRTLAFLAGGMLVALIMLPSGDVSAAALTRDQQNCVNAMNKDFRKVTLMQGKEIVACIKNGAKDKLAGTIEDCLTADAKLKVSKAKDKTGVDFGKKCVGTDKNGDPKFPPYGVVDPDTVDTVNDTGVAEKLALFHDVFGEDLDVSIMPELTDKYFSKCQQAIAKDVAKCQDTKLKEFLKCKKLGMLGKAAPSGADLPFDDPTDLELCMGDDPKGKILKLCVEKTRDKDIPKKCEVKGVDLSDAFPGCDTDVGVELAACLDERVECRVCLALNTIDGLNRDCDLFDDGVDNDSCPPVAAVCGDAVVEGSEECEQDGDCPSGQGCVAPGLPGECKCGDIMGAHKCVIDPGSSTIQILTQPLPLPPYAASGSSDIDCGVVDPVTGKAACSCTVQSFDPIEIVGIGYICFTPGPAGMCPMGEVDCDGGNALDVDMNSNHNIGACGGNQPPDPNDCLTQCEDHCDGMGAELFFSGCGGFCIGGANDGLPCTADSMCPGGSCPGKDGLPHGHQCQCDCLTVGGNPSRAGALQCAMATNINVEIGAPCGDGDVLIAVGTRCIPLTTETVTSQLHNANATPGKLFPTPAYTAMGVPGLCEDLKNSVTSGVTMVGTVNFFDSTIGDLHTNQTFYCQ